MEKKLMMMYEGDFNWKTKNEENDNTEDDVRSADNEAMAQNYWNNIKGYIVKLIKDIDSAFNITMLIYV